MIKRLQLLLARMLKRLGFDVWYDVATFSLRGHVCCSCGLRFHTERVLIDHVCPTLIASFYAKYGPADDDAGKRPASGDL